jgi:hypothetical protein
MSTDFSCVAYLYTTSRVRENHVKRIGEIWESYHELACMDSFFRMLGYSVRIKSAVAITVIIRMPIAT